MHPYASEKAVFLSLVSLKICFIFTKIGVALSNSVLFVSLGFSISWCCSLFSRSLTFSLSLNLSLSFFPLSDLSLALPLTLHRSIFTGASLECTGVAHVWIHHDGEENIEGEKRARKKKRKKYIYIL